MNITKHCIAALLILPFTISLAKAQDANVKPVNDYLQEYKDKHGIIIRTIEQSTAPLPERLALYESEMTKLKAEFKTARETEYGSKSVDLSVTNSATSRHNGGVTRSSDKCVTAPNSNMYTRTDWITVKGTNKGTYVTPDGTRACLKMSVAGSGRNEGTLYTSFRYHPDKIKILSESDMVELFKLIAKP